MLCFNDTISFAFLNVMFLKEKDYLGNSKQDVIFPPKNPYFLYITQSRILGSNNVNQHFLTCMHVLGTFESDSASLCSTILHTVGQLAVLLLPQCQHSLLNPASSKNITSSPSVGESEGERKSTSMAGDKV